MVSDKMVKKMMICGSLCLILGVYKCLILLSSRPNIIIPQHLRFVKYKKPKCASCETGTITNPRELKCAIVVEPQGVGITNQ